MGYILDTLSGGEINRVDYLARETDRLERRLATLTDLLVAKNILTRAEIDNLDGQGREGPVEFPKDLRSPRPSFDNLPG